MNTYTIFKLFLRFLENQGIIIQMKNIKIFLTLLIVGYTQVIQPLSQCLGNCQICDRLDSSLCDSQECFSGYQGSSKFGQCLIDQSKYKQFGEFGKGQKKICKFQPINGEIKNVQLDGIYKNQIVRKIFQVNSQASKFKLFFTFYRNTWQLFSDYVIVTVSESQNTLASSEISVVQKEKVNNFNIISCQNNKLNIYQYQMNIQITKFVNQIIVKFQGYFVDSGTWGISNVRLVAQCQGDSCNQQVTLSNLETTNILSRFQDNKPTMVQHIQTKTITESQKKNQNQNQKIRINTKNIIQKEEKLPPTKTNTKSENTQQNKIKKEQDNSVIKGNENQFNKKKQESNTKVPVQKEKKTILNEGVQQIQKKQQKITNQTNYSLSRFHLNSNRKVQYDIQILPLISSEEDKRILRVKLICPENKVIKNVRVGIDKLIPHEQKITKIQIKENSVIFDIQITQSFVDGILQIYAVSMIQINKDSDQQVSSTLTFDQPLLIKLVPINRFDVLTNSQLKSNTNITGYFQLFCWISLIGIIISIVIGYGILWQELVASLQLIFLHAYIFSEYIPQSLKSSISGLTRIQNLNFFIYRNQKSIESTWLGNVVQDSPLRLSQYRLDLNFLRGFYPIIIINICYLVWIGLVLALDKWFPEKYLNDKTKKIIKFIRNIGNKKIQYVDQIWRYQFLSTITVCFIQFYNFQYPRDSNRNGAINAILCIFSFLFTLSWPAIFVLFFKKKNKTLESQINWEKQIKLKEQIVNQETTIHQTYYFVLRYIKYFLYAICAVFLSKYPLFAAILMIASQISEAAYILYFKVFVDLIYIITRMVQNSIFIVLGILIMVIYGSSTYVFESTYMALGYICVSLFVLITLNSLFRGLYLIFKRVSYQLKTKNAGQEKVDFQEKSQQNKQVQNEQVRDVLKQSEKIQSKNQNQQGMQGQNPQINVQLAEAPETQRQF